LTSVKNGGITVAFKFFRAHFLIVLIALSLISLQFAVLMETRNSDLNFYLPFSRFWELAVGSVLAYRELNYKPLSGNVASRALPIFGLSLVVYSILFFDASTPHPSFHTLIPVLGVALIIGFASKDEIVGKILGCQPFVWMGLISYSAYLWHFPLFAFNRMDGQFGNKEILGLVLITICLSVISYRVIERPFRNKKVISGKSFSILLFGVTFSVCLFLGGGLFFDGYKERFTSSQVDVIQNFSDREFKALKHPDGDQGLLLRENTLSDTCYSRSPRDPCAFGNEKIVFLGDSYVGHYERALIDRTKPFDLGFISLTYGQCPFVSDQIWFGKRAECPLVNELRKERIEAFKDSKIFIVSANERQFASSKARTDKPLADGRQALQNGDPVDSDVAWNSYINNIKWLLSLGHKVVLIGSLPKPSINAQGWIVANKNYIDEGNYPNIFNESKLSDVVRLNESQFSGLEHKNLIFIDPSSALCDVVNDRCMDVKENVGPLYNGGRHLSYYGAAVISDQIVRSMKANNFFSPSDGLSRTLIGY
jgi:hypothetical protein